jgi:hypothetical protein
MALLMSLWLSWQVSGQAWLTWWQAQQREGDALLQLQTLQGQVDQHQQRVAALQAMHHPSGQDWPAWVSISPNNKDAQLQAGRDWRGSLPEQQFRLPQGFRADKGKVQRVVFWNPEGGR